MSGVGKIARVRCGANIALAKYWGKANGALNLPAVPSISLTLAELYTETTVEFDSRLEQDELLLDSAPVQGRARERMIQMLDRARDEARVSDRCRITTRNNFPTASGLASSASGFAALAGAVAYAAGLDHSLNTTSSWARRASASAARSVFAGFAELPTSTTDDDNLCARPIEPGRTWAEVRLIVAMVGKAPKSIGSTEAMERSRLNSPYYRAWLETAPRLCDEVREGLAARDLAQVGDAMERSTLAMHACALTASPSVRYWQPETLELIDAVQALRAESVGAWFTTDAGPHVKVLCLAADAHRVQDRLKASVPSADILVCSPGPGLTVLP